VERGGGDGKDGPSGAGVRPHTLFAQVVLRTTLGDLDVELWPKEAPLAVRNFVQLCLEGAYDDTPFHRALPGVAMQGGAVPPSAAPGSTQHPGGVSVHGDAPFRDEFHSRLRFARRGLVACAGGGPPHTNGSQFFVTTDPAGAPHLDRKHTIFGRVAGDSIYTVAAMAALEVGPDDAPLEPPRILDADVVWNPFDDIVPRSTREERDAKAAKARAAADAAAATARKAADKGRAKMLSFGGGDDDDDLDEPLPVAGVRSAHDAAAGGGLVPGDDPEAAAAATALLARGGGANVDTAPADANAAVFGERMARRAAERAAAERARPPSPPPAPEAPPPPPKPSTTTKHSRRRAVALPSKAGAAALKGALAGWEARRAAYASRRAGGAAAREEETLKRMQAFTAKLRETGGGGGKGDETAAPAPTTTTTAPYSGAADAKEDAAAYLPAAWRVSQYLDAGGDDVGVAALAAHRLVAPVDPRAAAAGTADDGLETVDPLALGPPPVTRRREGGGGGGGGGRRR